MQKVTNSGWQKDPQQTIKPTTGCNQFDHAMFDESIITAS